MDEIKLPCGLVLAREKSGKYIRDKCGVFCSIEPFDEDAGTFVAWRGLIGSGRVSKDEAISWLNSRVEELVSSLGAVIVPVDARERVAKAVYEAEWRDVSREDWPEFSAADFDFEAKHVLAALGLAGIAAKEGA